MAGIEGVGVRYEITGQVEGKEHGDHKRGRGKEG